MARLDPRARCDCGQPIDPRFTTCPDCTLEADPTLLFRPVPAAAVAAHPSSSWQHRPSTAQGQSQADGTIPPRDGGGLAAVT